LKTAKKESNNMTLNIDELTIGEVKQLQAMFGGVVPPPTTGTGLGAQHVGKYCVIRTFSAGVHVGVLKSRCGKEVELTDAKRIWYWNGANTLHEIASMGIANTSKVSDSVPAISLTEATEVIPCTAEAEALLRGAKWEK
jgi:uncharacterized protein DUF6948